MPPKSSSKKRPSEQPAATVADNSMFLGQLATNASAAVRRINDPRADGPATISQQDIDALRAASAALIGAIDAGLIMPLVCAVPLDVLRIICAFVLGRYTASVWQADPARPGAVCVRSFREYPVSMTLLRAPQFKYKRPVEVASFRATCRTWRLAVNSMVHCMRLSKIPVARAFVPDLDMFPRLDRIHIDRGINLFPLAQLTAASRMLNGTGRRLHITFDDDRNANNLPGEIVNVWQYIREKNSVTIHHTKGLAPESCTMNGVDTIYVRIGTDLSKTFDQYSALLRLCSAKVFFVFELYHFSTDNIADEILAISELAAKTPHTEVNVVANVCVVSSIPEPAREVIKFHAVCSDASHRFIDSMKRHGRVDLALECSM